MTKFLTKNKSGFRKGGVMKAKRFIESRGYFFFNTPIKVNNG